MRRHEISDEQWAFIEPMLPAHKAKTDRPPADHREMVNGQLWLLRTGAPWRDLPERFGPWETVYYHFNCWRKNGTLDKVLLALQVNLDRRDLIDWDLWCIDGSSVRAARCAAGARKKNAPGNAKEPADHALGRSRGGFGSKFHLLVDGDGLPLAVRVSPGQRHDSVLFEAVMDAARIPH